MKKHLLLLAIVALFVPSVIAQVPATVKLNTPNTDRGLSAMQAIQQRASATAFSDKEVELQDLSDLLWATNGINRPETGKRTAPSAMNCQDVDVYVILKAGAYLYDTKNHQLTMVTEGDHRALVSDRQANFANAPVMLVMVSDIARFTRGDDASKLKMGAIDAGIVSQNASIACAALGLKTRPRVSMNLEKLREVLKLSETQHPIINHPVSY